MPALHLRATLEPYGPAAAFLLTDDHVASLGGGKTPPVTITIGGTSVRGRVGRRGGDILVGLSKALRTELGVEPGDEVDVTIALDEAERTVELPPELRDALAADAAASAAFDALSFTRRKELAHGIRDAKQQATKERRLTAALDALRAR